MRAGLPILATPVGGLAEIVEPGVTGWQTDGLGADALWSELSALIQDREKLERVRGSGAIFDRFKLLCDPDEVLAGYDRLLNGGPPGPAPARRPLVRPEPAVTAVVPYNRSHAYVEEAVESLLAQTHRNLEVLIVNDGSFQREDEVLARLAALAGVSVITQVNRGEPSARNLGACLAEGEYLVMLRF